MNKIWITIILLVAVAVGGYAWWSAQDGKLTEDETPMVTPEASEPADDAVVEPDPEAEEESGLLDDATDAMDAAAAAATDAMDAATDAVGEAVEAMEDAVDAATDAADAAGDTAAETATDGVEAAADAMEAATETADEAADTAADAAADMAADATESAMSITDLLTVENFDADKINTMIDESALGEMQKSALKSAVDAAGDSPEAIAAVIDQVKQAMGL